MTFEQFKDLLLIVLPPISVLAGVVLSESLASQRVNRQVLANEVSQKKLTLYERLYDMLVSAHELAVDTFDSAKKAHKKTDIKTAIKDYAALTIQIAQFTDANSLYLDRDVVDHVLLMNLIPSELLGLNPASKNYKSNVDTYSKTFFEDYGTAVNMIEEYSGLSRLKSSLQKINSPNTKSSYAEYMSEVRKKYK